MIKQRILLGVVFLGVMAGLAVLWNTSLHEGLKVLVTVVGGYLSTSALLFFASTYFMVDSENRIIHGSFLYKYLKHWYTKEEKNEDGKVVKVVRMPEKIRICPSYWMIVVGLFSVSIVVGYISVFTYGFFHVVSKALTVGISVEPRAVVIVASVLGWLVLFVAVIVGGSLLAKSLKRTFLMVLVSSVTVVVAGGVLAGMAVHMDSLASEISVGASLDRLVSGFRDLDARSLEDAASGFGKYLGISILIMVAAYLLGLGVFVLAEKFFPWFKETAVWRILSAVYHQFCPEFEFSPAPQQVER